MNRSAPRHDAVAIAEALAAARRKGLQDVRLSSGTKAPLVFEVDGLWKTDC
jgi:hypothetical protein